MRTLRAVAAGAALVLVATGCSTASSPTSEASGPACPTDALNIVVSIDQWGDIVEQLAGTCGAVTTVITSSAADPHDFEPSTGDIASFGGAKLVVVNGDGYDEWATKAVEAVSTPPALFNVANVVGAQPGSNPHLWYNPSYVSKAATAVTAQLKTLAPSAASYFDQMQTKWQQSMKPYFATIDKIKSQAGGKTYAATEGVFDYMAAACGLADKTPAGYQNAAANETDPSPGDIAAFDSELTGKKVNVLIFNSQTEGAIPVQLRSTAESAGVPVVSVTETVPDGATSFQQWQIDQLNELAKALGIG